MDVVELEELIKKKEEEIKDMTEEELKERIITGIRSGDMDSSVTRGNAYLESIAYSLLLIIKKLDEMEEQKGE